MRNSERADRWASSRGLTDLNQGAKQEAWEARSVAAVAVGGLILLVIGAAIFV